MRSKKNYDASTPQTAEVLRVIGKAMNAYSVPQHGKNELRWYIHSETRAGESEDLAGFWSKDDGWTTLEGATAFASPPISMPSIGAPDARLITEVEAQLIVAQDVILQLQEALDSQATQISQMKGMFDDSDGAIERALEEAEEADTRAFRFLSALEQSKEFRHEHHH